MVTYKNQNNKRPVENFLVAGTGTTLLADGSTTLVNSTTSNINLANGRLGVFDARTWTATDTSPTRAEHPEGIFLAQGTADSADAQAAVRNATYPLVARTYEASHTLSSNGRITGQHQAYTAPTLSSWSIGKPTGTVGEIVAYDDTLYQIKIGYRGRRVDEYVNPAATYEFTPQVETVNFTVRTDITDSKDWLIQNMVWNIDRNSTLLHINRINQPAHQPVIAFAISSDGTTGVEIGGATPIQAGDIIPVLTTSSGVKNITLTAEQATAIIEATKVFEDETVTANLTSYILNVNLATAGVATGGTADGIILMAVDAKLAYDDRVPQIGTRLEVGLTTGFDSDSVDHTEGSQASEGSGSGRVWDRQYRNTQGQRKYNLDHWWEVAPEYASPVNTAADYDSIIVTSSFVDQIDLATSMESMRKDIILIPTAETTLREAVVDALISFIDSVQGDSSGLASGT